MMQVIRVCDNEEDVRWVSKQLLHWVCVQINVQYSKHFFKHNVLHFSTSCLCVYAAFLNALLPSQGECGSYGAQFGDSKCIVPQSLRPLNYLSSSP